MKSGAEFICEVLTDRGIDCVFGLPGSQNVSLFSAMRKSTIRAVVTNHEMSAGFAALGYAAVSNSPGVMAIIGGPGFTYAVTPLVEAKHDSIPIVCMVFAQHHDDGKSYHTQQLSYAEMTNDICKDFIHVTAMDDFATSFDAALALCAAGDPGPVVLLINAQLQFDDCTNLSLRRLGDNKHRSVCQSTQLAIERIRSKKLLILAGRGTINCAEQLKELAEKTGAPVLSSTSARGVLPEDHPLALVTDLVPVDLINEFVSGYSVILAIGIRLGENSSRGYRLNLCPDRLIHVDASVNGKGRNYEAAVSLTADASGVISTLLSKNLSCPATDPSELELWRNRFRNSVESESDPVFRQVRPATARAFFDQLRDAMPRDGILVCDSGTHQMLARKYFRSLSPGGFLLPTNFQSMGYAISVALGSKVAEQDRTVVALIGDGGLQMCGLELLASVKNKAPFVVIVFCDGRFGYIRQKQIAHDGYEYGVDLIDVDIEQFCKSLSCGYSEGINGIEQILQKSETQKRPIIVQINVADSMNMRQQIAKSRMKAAVKGMVGRKSTDRLKKVLARYL